MYNNIICLLVLLKLRINQYNKPFHFMTFFGTFLLCMVIKIAPVWGQGIHPLFILLISHIEEAGITFSVFSFYSVLAKNRTHHLLLGGGCATVAGLHIIKLDPTQQNNNNNNTTRQPTLK